MSGRVRLVIEFLVFATAVVGFVVVDRLSIAAGLLVSSRHAADETVQGIAETAAFAAAGGFIGWRIGLQVTR